MMRFRKKAVEVEAIRVADALHLAQHRWQDLPTWLHTAYENGGVRFLRDVISVTTLEGEMRGTLNDWIIRGVKGELYLCKPDIFAATYEVVE